MVKTSKCVYKIHTHNTHSNNNNNERKVGFSVFGAKYARFIFLYY